MTKNEKDLPDWAYVLLFIVFFPIIAVIGSVAFLFKPIVDLLGIEETTGAIICLIISTIINGFVFYGVCTGKISNIPESSYVGNDATITLIVGDIESPLAVIIAKSFSCKFSAGLVYLST